MLETANQTLAIKIPLVAVRSNQSILPVPIQFLRHKLYASAVRHVVKIRQILSTLPFNRIRVELAQLRAIQGDALQELPLEFQVMALARSKQEIAPKANTCDPAKFKRQLFL